MSILSTFYVFLPAYIANAAPVCVMGLPFVIRHNRPLWKSRLGANKTWAGLIAGTLAGMLTGIVQYAVADYLPAEFSFLHQTLSHAVLVGFLLGFGALIGDAAKSFFKRAVSIAPGNPLPFIDGIDHIVGGWAFLFVIYAPPPWNLAIVIILSPLISLGANGLAYWLGMKKVWH